MRSHFAKEYQQENGRVMPPEKNRLCEQPSLRIYWYKGLWPLMEALSSSGSRSVRRERCLPESGV
jgi:hypothetical protein